MMVYRWSSAYCLKDVALSGSGFLLCERSMVPSQNFRLPTARINNSGISLVSAHAIRNFSLQYDDGGFLPVFPRRMAKDVLSQNGRFIHRPISPAHYYSKLSEKDSSAALSVKAHSSPDKQGDSDPSKSHGIIPSVVGLVTGIIGLLIKLIPKFLVPFWSKEKGDFHKIPEEVKEAAEVVEEVVEDVKEIAELSEKFSEEVAGKTREEGSIHKTAESVDSFSKEVVKDAEIVENIAETVAQTTKTVDETVENAIDEVEDIVDHKISKGLTTLTPSSSTPSDQSLKDSSAESSKFVNSADVPSNGGIDISEGIIQRLVGYLVGRALTYADLRLKGKIFLITTIAVFCILSVVQWSGCLPLVLVMA